MLTLQNRLLTNTGISVVTDEYATNFILKNGSLPQHIRVSDSEDARKYEEKYLDRIIYQIDNSVPSPSYQVNNQDIEDTISFLLSASRDDTDKKVGEERVKKELSFFISSNKIEVLCILRRLIKRFKDEDVVWGVGRGSSCASYVLYLLEVHDVNPIKYNISFTEFSKIQEEEYESTVVE